MRFSRCLPIFEPRPHPTLTLRSDNTNHASINHGLMMSNLSDFQSNWKHLRHRCASRIFVNIRMIKMTVDNFWNRTGCLKGPVIWAWLNCISFWEWWKTCAPKKDIPIRGQNMSKPTLTKGGFNHKFFIAWMVFRVILPKFHGYQTLLVSYSSWRHRENPNLNMRGSAIGLKNVRQTLTFEASYSQR